MVKLVTCGSRSFGLAHAEQPDTAPIPTFPTLSKEVEMTNEILVSISGLIGVGSIRS